MSGVEEPDTEFLLSAPVEQHPHKFLEECATEKYTVVITV